MSRKQPTTSEPRHARGSRTLAYLRVSTRTQERDGLGLDVQRQRVQQYASGHGLELVDVVVETASGGVQAGETFSWEHRPQLLAILERAAARHFDILLVAKLDRLSRDHATLVALERMLAKHAVEVVSVAEEHNGDGPLAELIRGQLALIAQFERATIRERFAAGRELARSRGQHVHGRHPYGYRASKPGILEPDPETAPVVRRIFDLAAQGKNPGRIAGVLNHEGTPTPQRAGTWSRQAVGIILRNRAYLGEREGKKRAHQAIVSRKTFDDVQAQLDTRRRRATARQVHHPGRLPDPGIGQVEQEALRARPTTGV